MITSILQMEKARQKVKYKARSGNVWQNAFLTESALLIYQHFPWENRNDASAAASLEYSHLPEEAKLTAASIGKARKLKTCDSVLPAQDISEFLSPEKQSWFSLLLLIARKLLQRRNFQ